MAVLKQVGTLYCDGDKLKLSIITFSSSVVVKLWGAILWWGMELLKGGVADHGKNME